MRVAWASWVQGRLGLAKAALFITLAVVIVQQVYFGPTRLASARAEVIRRFEQERQGAKNRPSVLYVPVKRGATESMPTPPPPGIFP